MFILFLFSFFGILSALRITGTYHAEKFLTNNELAKIGTGMFVISILLVSAGLSRATLAVVFALLLGLLSVAPLLRWSYRERVFRREFEAWLNHLLLLMKTGMSLRAAVSQATEEAPASARIRLKEVSDLVVFSPQSVGVSSRFVDRVVAELRRADQFPHFCLRQLEELRDRLVIETDFRRRSNQAQMQVRAQAAVLATLYLLVLVFILQTFGWRGHQELILLSVTMFAVGALWLLQVGRRFRWKI